MSQCGRLLTVSLSSVEGTPCEKSFKNLGVASKRNAHFFSTRRTPPQDTPQAAKHRHTKNKRSRTFRTIPHADPSEISRRVGLPPDAGIHLEGPHQRLAQARTRTREHLPNTETTLRGAGAHAGAHRNVGHQWEADTSHRNSRMARRNSERANEHNLLIMLLLLLLLHLIHVVHQAHYFPYHNRLPPQ